ncbi:hypothetical protein PR048_005132 [Dryococelus australis]|uniref:Uncharacterized protein n=1 Tax=Dryococelus australis TaxID=614101 RepID=A0ABQ9I880_9NEOP|nr:hypothetical protein PR048_005132 [Dryococelus australis]
MKVVIYETPVELEWGMLARIMAAANLALPGIGDRVYQNMAVEYGGIQVSNVLLREILPQLVNLTLQIRRSSPHNVESPRIEGRSSTGSLSRWSRCSDQGVLHGVVCSQMYRLSYLCVGNGIDEKASCDSVVSTSRQNVAPRPTQVWGIPSDVTLAEIVVSQYGASQYICEVTCAPIPPCNPFHTASTDCCPLSTLPLNPHPCHSLSKHPTPLFSFSNFIAAKLARRHFTLAHLCKVRRESTSHDAGSANPVTKRKSWTCLMQKHVNTCKEEQDSEYKPAVALHTENQMRRLGNRLGEFQLPSKVAQNSPGILLPHSLAAITTARLILHKSLARRPARNSPAARLTADCPIPHWLVLPPCSQPGSGASCINKCIVSFPAYVYKNIRMCELRATCVLVLGGVVLISRLFAKLMVAQIYCSLVIIATVFQAMSFRGVSTAARLRSRTRTTSLVVLAAVISSVALRWRLDQNGHEPPMLAIYNSQSRPSVIRPSVIRSSVIRPSVVRHPPVRHTFVRKHSSAELSQQPRARCVSRPSELLDCEDSVCAGGLFARPSRARRHACRLRLSLRPGLQVVSGGMRGSAFEITRHTRGICLAPCQRGSVLPPQGTPSRRDRSR